MSGHRFIWMLSNWDRCVCFGITGQVCYLEAREKSSANFGIQQSPLPRIGRASCWRDGSPVQKYWLLFQMRRNANKVTSLDAAMPLPFHVVAHSRGASEFYRWSRHYTKPAGGGVYPAV